MNDEQSVLATAIAAQAESLNEFGYSDVTPEMVRATHEKWMAGEPLVNIIERFCEGAFDKHPDLFGTPGGAA